MSNNLLELALTLGIITIDVRDRINLEQHLETITFLITELENQIEALKKKKTPHTATDNLKNEFWRLKYEILEQI